MVQRSIDTSIYEHLSGSNEGRVQRGSFAVDTGADSPGPGGTAFDYVRHPQPPRRAAFTLVIPAWSHRNGAQIQAKETLNYGLSPEDGAPAA